MTLTLPTIAPSPYALTSKDFLLCKADRAGALRKQNFTVAVPAVTVSGTLIGLVPFQKGFSIALNGLIVSALALDSTNTATFSLGYTYYDSTLGTSSQNAWANAATTFQAGGTLTISKTVEAAINWTAAAPGWITILTGGASTDTLHNIFGCVTFAYDQDLGV